MQIVLQAAGSEKMEFLPKVLTDLLRTLLSQPTDITVKTVCQLLKVRTVSVVTYMVVLVSLYKYERGRRLWMCVYVLAYLHVYPH